MLSITAKYNQTLLDLALQGSGSFEQLFATAELTGLSITDDINPGDVISVPDAALDKQKVATFFSTRFPANGTVTALAGIGYWFIGADNVVS